MVHLKKEISVASTEAPISITVKSAAGSLITVRASNAEELDQTVALTLASLASATTELEAAVRGAAPANAADTRYITISATGTTNVVPDAVRITASVSVIGKSSKEALATASTTASAVQPLLPAQDKVYLNC